MISNNKSYKSSFGLLIKIYPILIIIILMYLLPVQHKWIHLIQALGFVLVGFFLVSIYQNRAKRFGSVTVSHFWDERTSLNAKVLATSERWTPMIGSFSSSALVPGYAVLNLSADHQVRPDLKLSFSVLNALDKTYFHLDGYNNPSRTYHMGLKYAYR